MIIKFTIYLIVNINVNITELLVTKLLEKKKKLEMA